MNPKTQVIIVINVQRLEVYIVLDDTKNNSTYKGLGWGSRPYFKSLTQKKLFVGRSDNDYGDFNIKLGGTQGYNP